MPFWRGDATVVPDVLWCHSVLVDTALKPLDEIIGFAGPGRVEKCEA